MRAMCPLLGEQALQAWPIRLISPAWCFFLFFSFFPLFLCFSVLPSAEGVRRGPKRRCSSDKRKCFCFSAADSAGKGLSIQSAAAFAPALPGPECNLQLAVAPLCLWDNEPGAAPDLPSRTEPCKRPVQVGFVSSLLWPCAEVRVRVGCKR